MSAMFPTSLELFVGDLSFFCSEQDLVDLFSTFGIVESVRIVRNDARKRSLMFGFVKLTSAEDAEAALQALHGTLFLGRTLKVEWSDRRHDVKTNKTAIELHLQFSSTFPQSLIVKPTEALLRGIFEKYGALEDVVVREYIEHSSPVRQVGYGFVAFANRESAQQAAVECSSLVVHGIVISASISRRHVKDSSLPSPRAVTSSSNNNVLQQLHAQWGLHGGALGGEGLVHDLSGPLSPQSLSASQGRNQRPDALMQTFAASEGNFPLKGLKGTTFGSPSASPTARSFKSLGNSSLTGHQFSQSGPTNSFANANPVSVQQLGHAPMQAVHSSLHPSYPPTQQFRAPTPSQQSFTFSHSHFSDSRPSPRHNSHSQQQLLRQQLMQQQQHQQGYVQQREFFPQTTSGFQNQNNNWDMSASADRAERATPSTERWRDLRINTNTNVYGQPVNSLSAASFSPYSLSSQSLSTIPSSSSSDGYKGMTDRFSQSMADTQLLARWPGNQPSSWMRVAGEHGLSVGAAAEDSNASVYSVFDPTFAHSFDSK